MSVSKSYLGVFLKVVLLLRQRKKQWHYSLILL
nr:MAG TPA: hypothetical protein [Caudoviricetes sp.]DAN72814.1 MAG TPA: hypothetical protein [Caudoviricetes sp.]